jgi:hypothetical protein
MMTMLIERLKSQVQLFQMAILNNLIPIINLILPNFDNYYFFNLKIRM